ncbi:MAG: hypothetical protein L3J16_02985 [Anaerolineales bacterium]|nr:hypothetical protein [Anaerolineales bacterium]
MLDNLRDDAASSPFYDDDETLPDFLEEEEDGSSSKSFAEMFAWMGPVLTMTPVQRLILSGMLFMMICVIGTMFLLVTGRFGLF